MSNYTLTLSTTEPNNLVGLLKFRQGDKDSQVLNVTVTENGKLFNFDRLAVFFNAVLPNGNVVRDKVTEVDYVNSKLNYIVADSFLQEVAAISAWFSFESGNKTVDSTKNFRYIVEAGWQSCITQGNYIYELSEIQREIEEIISNKNFTSLLSKILSLETEIPKILSLETDVKYLDNSKASKDDLNIKISQQNEKITNIISGTPKGIYENLSSLKLAYPSGASGVFLTKDSGHWYYWNNGSWNDGGIYQAEKDNEPVELANGWQLTNNTLVIGWDKNSLDVIQIAYQEAMTLKINVSELRNRVFEFKAQPVLTQGQFLVLADDQNKKIFNISQPQYDELVNGTDTEYFCEINEDIVRLYFDDFTAFYPNIEFIYITLSNQNITDFYFKEIHADKPMSNLIIEYINGCVSRGYDLQTKQPIYLPVNWMHYIKIKNTGMGRIKFPSKQLNTVAIQLLYFLDSDGNVVKNVPYAETLTAGSSEYHEEKDGYVTIFLDKIPTIYPTFLLGVTTSVEMSTDWYAVEGAFTIAERFPEINNYNKKVWEMLDDVAYNIVDGQTGYIYPDSFAFNSDLENANNLWTSGMVGREAKITSSSTNVRWTYNNSLVRDVRINKIPSSAGEGGTFNVMLIGESTTDSFDFLASLKEVCDTDLATFNFVGKKTAGGVNYEAYAGWGIGTLWHAQTANNKTNNFWNPANQHFDLDYYFTQNPTISVPDIVSISYGINDVNRYVTSSTTMVEHYENIIAQFKAKNPGIKILIGLTHAYSLHENFRGIKTRDDIMNRVNELIAQFKNRESDGIYLNPMFYNLDCVYGMQYEEIQAHPFNPTKTIMLGTDSVHPSIYGYKQTAQMTYWSLKNAINQM